MGSIEENKAICRKFHVNIMEGKFSEAVDLMSDDVVWWVQGNLPVSGYHHGKDAIKALLAPLIGLPNGIAFEFGEVTAEGDRVSSEIVGRAKISEGREYNNTYHMLFTVKDGLIVQGQEYLDTQIAQKALFEP
jgi:ketosteroid isomerase-like protein